MASKNKRKRTFKEEYSRSWDFIKPSRKGENHARCTLCSADFSIAASGRYDITQRIATAKHRSNAERKDSNQSILQFVEACLCMFLKNTGFYWKIQVCGLQNTGLYFQRLACLLRNCDTIELICFVTHIKHQIDHRRTFPRLSKATWPVVMAVDIVAMVTYIYYGKSVVRVLSPRGKVWVWGLGLNMPSRYSGGRALSNTFV